MKKILTMVVGLLTAIALLAVVAVAQDGGSEAPPQTAAAVAEQPAAPGGAPDGDASEEGSEGTADDADPGAADDGEESDWCEPEDGKEQMLAELAAEGVINQDQIPAIVEWMKAQGPALETYENPTDLLNAAVADGVITQTQADDIANLINQWKEMEGGETDECPTEEDVLKVLLEELASEGVIDGEQIPGIVDWMKAQGPALDDYEDPAGLLAAAVADGVITQTQADDIANLINQMEQAERGSAMSS